jgi:hypothetical protein
MTGDTNPQNQESRQLGKTEEVLVKKLTAEGLELQQYIPEGAEQ